MYFNVFVVRFLYNSGQYIVMCSLVETGFVLVIGFVEYL
jgi:energy-converting hydrogenase Eha subunit C